MKTAVHICLIAFFILEFAGKEAFSQENYDTLAQKTCLGIVSPDTNTSVDELLFIADVMRMAHQDCTDLIPFNPNENPLTQSYSGIINSHGYYYSSLAQLNSDKSLLYQYSKTDVSKSRNLDYKSLSKKYPKTLDLGNSWGRLIYDIIYMGTSSSNLTRGK
jgi:hypothetical protein